MCGRGTAAELDPPPMPPGLVDDDETPGPPLKREYGELQQLREAVTEAERTYLNRQLHPQARPLS